MIQITGLDGKTYKWNYSKYYKRRERKHSNLHDEARGILQEKFKNYSIYEEVTLPGSDLYADFFIPQLSLIIEVHGEQHYKHIPFFHKTYAEFLLGQKRDRDKKRWCELNEITYIELPFNKIDDWPQICENI